MVSVCMATYNGEKYIADQIKSILSEIRIDDELIISDDGSNDLTINIVKSFNDKRIIIVENSCKHGIVGNFENSLRLAKGDYIFLADQDDIWIKGKYECMLQALQKYDLVHCNSIVTDENMNIVCDSFYSVLNSGKGIWKNIFKSTYFGSHMAFKRKLLDYALPFPNTNQVGHDLWLGLVAEIVGKVCFLEDKLMYYRRHNDTHCDIFEKSNRPFVMKISGRFIMLYYLICFWINYKLEKQDRN